MTSTAETRWYENPRLGGSPNAGTSHQGSSSGGNASGNGNNGGIVDASDMGAFYSLENAGHRRYYSTGYAPHGKFHIPFSKSFIIRLKTDFFRVSTKIQKNKPTTKKRESFNHVMNHIFYGLFQNHCKIKHSNEKKDGKNSRHLTTVR